MLLAFTVTSHLMTALVTALLVALLVWWICRRREADTPIWTADDLAAWHHPDPALVGEIVQAPVRRRLAITALPVLDAEVVVHEPVPVWDPLTGDLPDVLEPARIFGAMLLLRDLERVA